jgi:hypothetical protein
MSPPSDASGAVETEKSEVAVNRSSALAIAARSPRRSSLFWWLFDNHDDLIEARGRGGLGFSWTAMCAVFVELQLTLVAGAPITPERARQTWWRVRKEKVRLRQLEAEANAEHAFKRERDPRRNMPSRMSGRYEAPLAEVQPRRPIASPGPSHAWNGAGSLKEGADLPADAPMVVIFQGEPLDLNLFVLPEGKEPWDDPELLGEEKHRVKFGILNMRFECWKSDRVLDPNNRVDRERKRINVLRNPQR